MMSGCPVIHDHDGHIDDLISLAMLANAGGLELHATTLCPADCYPEPAILAVERLLTRFGKSDVRFACGREEGIHPFPPKWRKDSFRLPELPILREAEGTTVQVLPRETAPQFLARTLSGSRSFDLIETGPLTNIAEALTLEPGIVSRIRHLWVMGGAIDVSGNVSGEEGHDGSAEWNFFNHPAAARKVLTSGMPITLIPLDVTNHLPLTEQFIGKLRAQSEYPLSRFACQAWEVVLNNPENDYYLWDVLTVAAYLQPERFRMGKRRISVVTEGASQGRTAEDPRGAEVEVPVSVDRAEIERFFLEFFRR